VPFFNSHYNEPMTPESSTTVDKSAEIFQALRNKLLSLVPQEVDIIPTPEHPHVWGVLMEFVLSRSVVTLAGLVDGTTSLYYSTGGGILGSGNHPIVGAAAREMVSKAEAALEFFQPVSEYPFPDEGFIRFYALTFNGIHMAECPDVDLQDQKHGLSELYDAAQNLITQIRLIKEQKGAG
jgi:glycine/D-amino acid oxidase-like deaminating enzyme